MLPPLTARESIPPIKPLLGAQTLPNERLPSLTNQPRLNLKLKQTTVLPSLDSANWSTHLCRDKTEVLLTLGRLGSPTSAVSAALGSDVTALTIKCRRRHPGSPLEVEIHTSQVAVYIEGLPGSYVLHSELAKSNPRKEAEKLYFRVFGTQVHSINLPHPPPVKNRLSTNAVLITASVLVRCIPMHRASCAATSIARFWRRLVAKSDGWSAVASAVRQRSLSLPQNERSTRQISDAFVKAIVEDAFVGISTGISDPRGVLTFGFPGSGKTWLGEGKSDHVVVDVDAVLGSMPRFWEKRAEVALVRVHKARGDWVFPMRDEARRIADMIFDEALLRRANVIWVGTGRTLEAYLAMTKRMRDLGYTIATEAVAVRSATARARMLGREREFKRPVPRRVLTDAIAFVPKHFARVGIEADHSRVFWNGSPFSTPRLIWDNHHGVLDSPRWKQWNNPSPLLATPPLPEARPTTNT